jgi:hypothetical protein
MFGCHSKAFGRVDNSIDHQLAMDHTYVRSLRQDMMLLSRLTLRLCRLRSHVYRRTIAILRYILVLDSAHHWDTRTCYPGKRSLYSWLRRFRQRNHDNHRNGNLPVYRVHWHIEIGHRGMAESLKKKWKLRQSR